MRIKESDETITQNRNVVQLKGTKIESVAISWEKRE